MRTDGDFQIGLAHLIRHGADANGDRWFLREPAVGKSHITAASHTPALVGISITLPKFLHLVSLHPLIHAIRAQTTRTVAADDHQGAQDGVCA